VASRSPDRLDPAVVEGQPPGLRRHAGGPVLAGVEAALRGGGHLDREGRPQPLDDVEVARWPKPRT
jgi:hypothetical protein